VRLQEEIILSFPFLEAITIQRIVCTRKARPSFHA